MENFREVTIKKLLIYFQRVLNKIEKFQGISATFSSNNNNRKEHKKTLDPNLDILVTLIKMDSNETRIGFKKLLLHSTLII